MIDTKGHATTEGILWQMIGFLLMALHEHGMAALGAASLVFSGWVQYRTLMLRRREQEFRERMYADDPNPTTTTTTVVTVPTPPAQPATT